MAAANTICPFCHKRRVVKLWAARHVDTEANVAVKKGDIYSTPLARVYVASCRRCANEGMPQHVELPKLELDPDDLRRIYEEHHVEPKPRERLAGRAW